MKRLYVCGSFRFLREMQELESKLKEKNIQYQMPKKKGSHGILGCLKKIDEADVVYVVNPEGYVGKSVCVDIGYAFARDKPIYVMHPVDDPSLMNLINDVLSFEELITLLKQSAFTKA